jgi:hypothetical protein
LYGGEWLVGDRSGGVSMRARCHLLDVQSIQQVNKIVSVLEAWIFSFIMAAGTADHRPARNNALPTNGRGRHPPADVPEDFAADRRTPAAASACTGMRRSMVMRSRATDGRSASRCPAKMARSAPRPPFGVPGLRPPSAPSGGLVRTRQKRKNPPRFEAHLENPRL